MMMNIFSIFDPSSSYSLSVNWLSMTLVIIFLPIQFWLIPSRILNFSHMVYQFIFKEFSSLVMYSQSNLMLFLTLFTFIICNNFLGLFPYIFTASSHMNMNLSLSLSIWLGIISYSIKNYFNDLLSHITPQGTPPILMPFMVMIESISLIIRPLTLAIRLTANMIAGHLLLSLLGSTGSSIHSSFLMMSMMLTQFMLFILEMSVSMIQAYVFAVLATLYSSEA